MLDSQRKLAYPGAVADRKIRQYLPPVRLIAASGRIAGAECLTPSRPVLQSYLGGSPPICRMEPGSEIILDFGIELHGGVRIVTGACDMQCAGVLLTFGESVSEAMQTPVNDHAIHQSLVDLPPLGMAEFGNTAFRFVRLSLPENAPRGVDLFGVTAVALFRDLEYLGRFESDDPRLNAIWQTAAYTVHLNMQDYVYDGVKRDRLVWMGDLYPEVRVIAAAFDDGEAVEASLDFMDRTTPADAWMNGISSYTCWWVVCHGDWYLWRGDRAYLERQRQGLKIRLGQLLAAVGPDGREALGDGRFLDWPNSEDPAAIHAGLQGLLAWALASGAALLAELGENVLAEACRSGAARLRANPPPPGMNKTAAAMQVLGGMLDPEEAEKSIFSIDPFSGVSTFYGYFVLLARARAGRAALPGVLDLIRRYWGGMLDFGATTFWEDFDLAWTANAGRIDEMPQPGKDDLHADFGNYCYRGLRHSLCHGWAGGPAAFLSECILGITPLAPGFRRFRCAPELAGLGRIEGSVPTPCGPITVRAEDSGGFTLTVPPGCVAVLPDGSEVGHGVRTFVEKR